MQCAAKGYDEALAQEQYARNVAYLGLPEYVCGEPLNNVTPWLLDKLTVANSPFIVGGKVTWEKVAEFLWALHVDWRKPAWYRFGMRRSKKRLALKCAGMNLEYAMEEIQRFLTLTDMDAPRGGKAERPIASNTAWLVYRFRNEPWRMTQEQTLHTPLRLLYQELRCWTREHTEETITNPSNVKIQEWQEGINRALAEGKITQEHLDEYNAACRKGADAVEALRKRWREGREQGRN